MLKERAHWTYNITASALKCVLDYIVKPLTPTFQSLCLAADRHERISMVRSMSYNWFFSPSTTQTPVWPGQNCRQFPDDNFKCDFFNESVWILIKISLNFVPKAPNNNIPALVQIMAWRRPGDKTLSEPMMFSLLTHICVTRPQWVKFNQTISYSFSSMWHSTEFKFSCSRTPFNFLYLQNPAFLGWNSILYSLLQWHILM